MGMKCGTFPPPPLPSSGGTKWQGVIAPGNFQITLWILRFLATVKGVLYYCPLNFGPPASNCLTGRTLKIHLSLSPPVHLPCSPPPHPQRIALADIHSWCGTVQWMEMSPAQKRLVDRWDEGLCLKMCEAKLQHDNHEIDAKWSNSYVMSWLDSGLVFFNINTVLHMLLRMLPTNETKARLSAEFVVPLTPTPSHSQPQERESPDKKQPC